MYSPCGHRVITSTNYKITQHIERLQGKIVFIKRNKWTVFFMWPSSNDVHELQNYTAYRKTTGQNSLYKVSHQNLAQGCSGGRSKNQNIKTSIQGERNSQNRNTAYDHSTQCVTLGSQNLNILSPKARQQV